MRSDILPGGTFPDYELPDHENVPRRLSELQGDDPMIPHTLVLKPGLVIQTIYNGYWFWGRPSFVDLWHDLRAATSEMRPDWGPEHAGAAPRMGCRGPVSLPRVGQAASGC